jgi:uncharacterized protein (TIRG00374 family)
VNDGAVAPAARRPRAWRIAAAFAVSGGLLAILLSTLDLHTLGQRVASVDLRYVAASFGASVWVLLARGLRFHALATRSPRRLTLAVTAVQNFLNRVTPMRLGELSLPYLLSRHAGEPVGSSLVALLLARLLDLWVMWTVALGGALIVFGLDARAHLGWTLAAVVALSAALIGLRWWLARAVRFARWCAVRLRLDQASAVRRGLSGLDAAVEDVGRVAGRRRLAVVAWSLAIQAGQYVLYGLLLRAFGVVLPPEKIVVGVTIASAVGSLPVGSVGSVGTHETAWVAGFLWVGLPLEDAVVTGIATQVLTLAYATIFALPAWLGLHRRAA